MDDYQSRFKELRVQVIDKELLMTEAYFISSFVCGFGGGGVVAVTKGTKEFCAYLKTSKPRGCKNGLIVCWPKPKPL